MQRGTKTKELIESYDLSCNNIVDKFTSKHGLEFDGWVGNEVGGIACFNCQYHFGISDIILDLKTNQKKWFILKWQDESVEHCINNEKNNWINYQSYIMGLRYDQL